MSTDDWKKENTTQYNIRVTKSSGIPEAIEEACKKSQKTATQYIREALCEKLQREGYLPEKINRHMGEVKRQCRRF